VVYDLRIRLIAQLKIMFAIVGVWFVRNYSLVNMIIEFMAD
jgi:hypothetical protein